MDKENIDYTNRCFEASSRMVYAFDGKNKILINPSHILKVQYSDFTNEGTITLSDGSEFKVDNYHEVCDKIIN